MLNNPPDRDTGPWPEWLTSRIGQAVPPGGSEPVLLILSGPPGSGKTTLASQLVRRLAARGQTVQLLSLDDFYCTARQRRVLAAAHHPALARRGLPGTHDLALLGECLGALTAGLPVALPRFDKAADERLPARRPRRHPIPDGILLEGWCLGARRPARCRAMPADLLEFISQQLPRYQSLTAGNCGHWHLRAPEWIAVEAWRHEQEFAIPNPYQRMGRLQVNRFLQWYRPLVYDMMIHPPEGARVVRLDHGRDPRFLE